MNRLLISISLLVLVAGTIAALFFLRPGEDVDPGNRQPAAPLSQPDTPSTRPVAAPAEGSTASKPATGSVVREQVNSTAQTDPGSFAQGIKGRVADEQGNPVAAASVWLMPGIGPEGILAHLMRNPRGKVTPPIAKVTTDAQGRFAVGIAQAGDPAVTEIRVVAEHFVDGKVANLRIAAEEWHDVGTITLTAGTFLEGTVTKAGEAKTPIANAEVSLRPQSQMVDLSTVPGRERGLVARTDEQGHYRIEGAPAEMVTLAAVAPGFARIERPGIVISKDTQNRADFELFEGREISGTIVDAKGQPIAAAQVTAIAISAKTPVLAETRSERDGSFEVQGLIEGHYQLTVVCEGYARCEVKPVDAGSKGLQLTLEKLGSVQLQVYGKTNRLLSEYDVTVKFEMPGQDVYANTQVPPRHVRTRPGEVATIEGLEALGHSYVLQVEAPGHARAFSEPFKVTLGQEPRLLTVRLDEGGVIEGTVLGKDGAPLSGVVVETFQHDVPDIPLFGELAKMGPSNVTKTAARTGADGKLRLPLLNPGKYCLKLTHAEHFDVRLRDLDVRSGETLKLGDVLMQAGTVITGIVRVDGAPSGQVQVQVSRVTDPNEKQPVPFYGEATTGSDGRFTVAKRLPPGRYTVAASRAGSPNPFDKILDYNKTRQEFSVDGMQGQYLVELQITTK